MKDRNLYKYIKLIMFSLALMVSTVSVLADSVQVEAATIKLNKTKATVNENKQIKLQVKNPTSKVKWTTNKKSVVKIKATSGKKKQTVTLLGVKKGTATVTAQVGTKKLKCKVTVKHVHKWQAATCTMPKICSCGNVAGTPLGHNFSAATCTEGSKCTRCNLLGTVALGHNYVDGFCSRCKDVNLTGIVSIWISTVPTTNIVTMSVCNFGVSSLQICDDTGSFGTGTLHLSNGSNQPVWLWDNYDGEYVNTWTFTGGDQGLIWFTNESNNWVTDPSTTVEFDLFYNHVRCHAIVGTSTSAMRIVKAN